MSELKKFSTSTLAELQKMKNILTMFTVWLILETTRLLYWERKRKSYFCPSSSGTEYAKKIRFT